MKKVQLGLYGHGNGREQKELLYKINNQAAAWFLGIPAGVFAKEYIDKAYKKACFFVNLNENYFLKKEIKLTIQKWNSFSYWLASLF